MISGRRRSVIFFTVLGVCLVALAVTLNISWVVLNWHRAVLVVLGIVLFIPIIAGMVLNTIFLVREIRRNEQHDSFINAVTHELKTPVASIRLYLQTLQSRELDEEKRREFYRIMLEDSDRSAADDRAGPAGRELGLALAPHFADPSRPRLLSKGCVELARTRFHLTTDALAYEQRVEAGACLVIGDADELKAAIWNLIDNAIKYSAGEVQVRVLLEEVDGERLAIKVSDNGVGISPVELKRIFRRFYRVPASVAIRAKGSGLGLFIVRSVAKKHGGRAFAESQGQGHGSTFTLLLPKATEA